MIRRRWGGLALVILALGARPVLAQPAAPAKGEPAAGEPTDEPADGEPPVQDIAPDEPETPVKVTPPVTAPAAEPAETAVPVHTMDEVTVPRSMLRFGINFFGDTSFVATKTAKPHASFALGALGIRLIGDLSASVDALAEFALESVEGGAVADVEQLAIRWRRGPGTLEVGRFHTDIGYWNRAYHHGMWLQTPIDRPHVVRFEDDGGLVQVHWVGGHYTVQFPVGGGTLALVGGVANGRGRVVDDVLVLGDTNAAKAVLFGVRFKTSAVDVGAGAIYDRIAAEPATVRPALPGETIDELTASVHAVVRTAGVLALGEAYAIRHSAGSQTWTTLAGYGLLGYTIADLVTPYAAIDLVAADDADPFFTPDPAMAAGLDLTEAILGLRIDVSTWSALKLEAQYLHRPGLEHEYIGVVNWSFGL